MADKEEALAPAPAGKKKLIIIVIVALVLIGGVVGATLMLVGGDETVAADEASTEPTKGDAVYIDLKPAFTVNLDPDDSVGFLQVSMQVLTFRADVAADIEKHKPLIRNNLMVLFGSQKSIDLRAPEGKESLQKAALAVVQSAIDEFGSGGEVDNVFFTTFVMQ